mmetsp:Transcript_19778/g.62271  ORF Transcript_19778/g.62271 Transcript_19778/m.62271 type:complete len:341 (+) Transcript_19778:91-1113(+)
MSTEDDASLYEEFEPMIVALEKTDDCGLYCRLVRMSWLLEQAARPQFQRFRRRQDLPEEAFIESWELHQVHTEASELIPGIEARRCPVIVVSHPWLSAEHPDPSGEQLRELCRALQDAESSFSAFSDMGIFFDFMSLFHDAEELPRTEAQKSNFKHGMMTANVLYTHRLTTTLVIQVGPPVEERGWIFFEITVGSLVRDLSPGYWNPLIFAPKQPPRSREVIYPHEFRRQLKSKRFRHEVDREKVAGLYEWIFQLTAVRRRRREFHGPPLAPPGQSVRLTIVRRSETRENQRFALQEKEKAPAIYGWTVADILAKLRHCGLDNAHKIRLRRSRVIGAVFT